MDLLQALSDWPVAAALRGSAVAYATVNAAHIFSLALTVGASVTLDLRLLGLFKAQPVGPMAYPLARVAAAGVALAAVTGFLLFSVRPAAYAQNPAFLVKLALVGVGVANALVLHASAAWRRAVTDGEVDGAVRLSALVSLTVWAGAVVAGRWIGFLD